MRRDVAQPLDAGGLEGDGGVEAAGDGAVDDGLLLLLQQLYQLLLGPDIPLYPAIHILQIADNSGLFGDGWATTVDHLEVLWPQTPHIRRDSVGPSLGFLSEGWSTHKVVHVSVSYTHLRAHETVLDL